MDIKNGRLVLSSTEAEDTGVADGTLLADIDPQAIVSLNNRHEEFIKDAYAEIGGEPSITADDLDDPNKRSLINSAISIEQAIRPKSDRIRNLMVMVAVAKAKEELDKS